MNLKQIHLKQSAGTKWLKVAAMALAFAGAAMSANAGQGPQPSICTRACWTARAPTCGITQMSGLTRGIIHHTAGSSDYSTDINNSKARVRAVQNLHIDMGWCDIAYHFLVDAAGNIFEGRSGSMSSLPRGTHDGNNSNSFGFNVLGYYHPPYNHPFTSSARNSLEAVIAWRMPSAWSPYGSGTYNGNTVGYLDGHYKVKSTACPGDGIIPLIGGIRDGVNARKNGAGAGVNEYIGVLAQDGTFSAKVGASGTWSTMATSATAFQIHGNRFAYLHSNGTLYAKDGMTAQWTALVGNVSKFQLAGNRIGVLFTDASISAKDGIGGVWFPQGSGQAFQLEGDRLAYLNAGTLYAKDGMTSQWSNLTSGVAEFKLKGNRIGVLYNNGTFAAKDGIGGVWFTQGGGQSFQLEGDRLGYISNGDLYLKDGMTSTWTFVGGNMVSFQLHGNRIAALNSSGTLFAKDGIGGVWYNLTSGVSAFGLDGDRIGMLSSGNMSVKYGMTGVWTLQAGPTVANFQLATGGQ